MRNIIQAAAKIFFSLLIMFALSSGLQWLVNELEESGNVFLAAICNISFSVLVFFLVRVFNKKYNHLSANVGSSLGPGE